MKDKRVNKISKEELSQWLFFKRRGFFIQNKKGKSSYSRKQKYKNKKY